MFNTGTLNLTSDLFEYNTATGGTGDSPNGNYGSGVGGGVFNGDGVLMATNDTFTHNTAQGEGGALRSVMGYGAGGGLANDSGNVIATGLVFTSNSALEAGSTLGAGGAIDTYYGTFILTNSNGTNDVGQARPFNAKQLNQGVYDVGTNINLSNTHDAIG